MNRPARRRLRHPFILPGSDFHLKRSSAFSILVLILVILWMNACSPAKKTIKTPIREEGPDYLFKQLKENELRFDRFTAKFSAEYRNKEQKSSFGGQIRIARDSIIWLSFSPLLGIEAIRIMITQDSVKFINRLNNTYFIGDYSYVNKFLKTDIDYDILQSFLIGNDLSFYENAKFRASLDRSQYKLSTAERTKLKKFVRTSQESLRILIQNIWIDPQTFKITQADVKEIKEPNIKLEANYSSFENISNQLFPKNMIFDISAENNIHVEVTFSKINIDAIQQFPFKIPPDYRRIF